MASDHFFSAEQLSWLGRILLAQCVSVFLIFMNVISFSIPYAGEVRPFFVLMAIYYWAIYRPTLIPPVLTFIIGVLLDLLAGFPVGLHAILFLILQWAVSDNRVFLMGQPYSMVWLGFGLTCVGFVFLEGLFFLAYIGGLPSLQVVLSSIALSVLLFPLITLLFIAAHRILPTTLKTLH